MASTDSLPMNEHRRRRPYAAAAALVLLLVARAQAHPHVWIDVGIVPIFDEAGQFTAVHERWALDAAYSDSVLPELDVNKDGILGASEIQNAPLNALWWIAYTYMTRITVGGEEVARDAPDDLRVTLPFDRLVVEFTLPLATPQVLTHDAGIDVFDPDNFYAYEFDDLGIYPSLMPASCHAKPRPTMLDPTAVMILKHLGLTKDPAILNDPAASFPVRVAIECD